jgi:hypothetical protein
MHTRKSRVKIKPTARTLEWRFVDDSLASDDARYIYQDACETAEEELGVGRFRIPLAHIVQHVAESIEMRLAIRRCLKQKPYFTGLDATEAADLLLSVLLHEATYDGGCDE